MPRLRVSSLRSGFSLLGLCLLSPCEAQDSASRDCAALREVIIETVRPLPQIDSETLARPYLGSCIDAETGNALLNAVSERFIEAGFVTSRPYLREQDITDGVLEISILAGVIEAFVDAESGLESRAISAAFLSAGETFNLREIEDGLETLERPPSVKASVEIRPGSRPGGSVVAVSRQTSEIFRIEFGANAQSELDNRLALLLSFDNPLQLNDILELRFNDGELRDLLQSNRNRELSYSMGLGAYRVEASHSEIDYRQRLQGVGGSFLSAGESSVDIVAVGRTLARGRSYRLGATLSLKLEDTENFLEDVRIEVSSYKTSQLRLGLRHEWYLSQGRWSNELTYHRGLDAFGARDDDALDSSANGGDEARLQFEKLVADSRLRLAIGLPGWYFDAGVQIQYSEDILFASDKLVLGSFHTVRGYASALSGSNAGYLRLDLTRQWARIESVDSDTSAKTISLSFGVDYGEAKCEVDNRDVCGQIYGTGLGFVVRDDNFSATLMWGRPLKRLAEDIGEDDRFLVDLRWTI